MRFRLALTGFTGLLIAGSALSEVTVSPESAGFRVKAATYEAVVASHGGISSLQVGATQFLETRVTHPYGTYFFQDGPVALTSVAKTTANTVRATGPKSEVLYTFGESSFSCRAANRTDKQMTFFLIVARQAAVMASPDGSYGSAPVTRESSAGTWFRGQAKLHVSGFTKLWGPWDNGTQVVELDIPPEQTATLTVVPATATASELGSVNRVAMEANPRELPLNLYSPRPLQVFQRTSLYAGAILVAGRVKGVADKVEVRITGTSIKGPLPGKWTSVGFDPATGSFRGLLPTVPGGWYRVEVRAKADGRNVLATVREVGVGEVFVGAGQSNSTNSGQQRIKQTSGMVSSFSGSDWRLADDPQPGCHDNSQGGSFWPAFGDAMYVRYKVPIGIASTGHGGTSVNQWQPGGELFNWMMTRIHQLGVGGFRAVLWHQGESDVAMEPDVYVQKLTNTIVGSKRAAGWDFPWFVAKVSYHNPDKPRHDSMRQAHQKLWDLGTALKGPDTDTLTGDNRDFDGKGIHFSPKGLKAHGQMWADKVGMVLDRVLGLKR